MYLFISYLQVTKCNINNAVKHQHFGFGILGLYTAHVVAALLFGVYIGHGKIVRSLEFGVWS